MCQCNINYIIVVAAKLLLFVTSKIWFQNYVVVAKNVLLRYVVKFEARIKRFRFIIVRRYDGNEKRCFKFRNYLCGWILKFRSRSCTIVLELGCVFFRMEIDTKTSCWQDQDTNSWIAEGRSPPQWSNSVRNRKLLHLII